MEIFFQSFKGSYSVDPGPILPNFEPIQAFIAVLVTWKNKEDPMKNGSYSAHKIVSNITLWKLSVAMETRVLVWSGPKPNAANPLPQ